jgi:EF hand
MFARIVAIGLLLVGIGYVSPVWAAGTNPNANTGTSADDEEGPPPVELSPTSPTTQPGTAATVPGTATTQPEAQPSGPETPTDKIVDAFMQLDTDKSNSVSFDEYMAMVQQRAKDRFDAMDTNHDGQVTPEEYRAFWQLRKSQWYRLKR